MDHLIKRTNEKLVLDIILENKAVTKKDIVNTTGLSFPTVSKIIDTMVQQKQIYMVGQSASINGRKAFLYQLYGDYANILTIYFQYQTFIITVGNIADEIIVQKEITMNTNSYLDMLYQIIDTYLDTYPNIKVIALGIPGGIKDGQVCYINHYEELQDLKIEELMVTKYHLPCVVERDVNSIMLGLQATYHYDREAIVSLLFLTKDGPGCTSLIHGDILRGNHAFAGEVGFLSIYDDTSLQEVMTTNVLHKKEMDAISRFLINLCSFINPQELIIIENEKDIFVKQEVMAKVEGKLPISIIPTIKVVKEYQDMYVLGLLELGRNTLFLK
jgi:predicted NBD/HSP70 family sugar kinase